MGRPHVELVHAADVALERIDRGAPAMLDACAAREPVADVALL